MAFLLLIAAILLPVLGLRSVLAAIRLLRSKEEPSTPRRRLWGLLVLGVLGGGYLSVGLVYASAKTRWFGAPLPVVVFQPMGDKWVDFVSPLSVIAPFYNFVIWLGLAFAPATLPRWWRCSGREWAAAWADEPAAKKAIWLGTALVLLVTPPLLGYLLTTRHVVTVRNRSATSIQELALSDGYAFRYRGSLPPGEERVFDFEQSMPGPYFFTRRDGKERIAIGQCDHTNGRLNRYVVMIAGEQADRVECVAQSR